MMKIKFYSRANWYTMTYLATIIAMIYFLCPVVSEKLPLYVDYCLMLLMCGLTVAGLLLKNKNQRKYSFLIIILIVIFIFIFYFGKWQLKDQETGVDIISRVYDLFSFWIFFLLSKSAIDFPENAKNRLCRFFFVLITITSITSLIGLKQYPLSSRLLAGDATKEERRLFLSMNIGSYDFVYGLALLPPFLLYMMQKGNKKVKVGLLILFCLTEYTIIRSQYTIAFLVSIMAVALYVIFYSQRSMLIGGLCALFIPFILISGILIPILEFAKKIILEMGLSTLGERINQLISLFNGTHLYGTSSYRVELYRMSLNVFSKSPIFGCVLEPLPLGGHSDLLDLLAAGGIITLLLFLCLLYSHEIQIKRRNQDCNFKYVCYIEIICFFSIALINTVFIMPIISMVFFWLPSILVGESFMSGIRKNNYIT